MRARFLAIVLPLLVANGCGFSSQPLEPLVVGSQQFFTIEWQAADRWGQRVLQGYVRNNWSFGIAHVRLLVEGLEPPDRVVGQRIITIGGQIMPGSRASFETMVWTAPAYRVRLFTYDWVESIEMSGR